MTIEMLAQQLEDYKADVAARFAVLLKENSRMENALSDVAADLDQLRSDINDAEVEIEDITIDTVTARLVLPS